jgi:hypothetical protein
VDLLCLKGGNKISHTFIEHHSEPANSEQGTFSFETFSARGDHMVGGKHNICLGQYFRILFSPSSVIDANIQSAVNTPETISNRLGVAHTIGTYFCISCIQPVTSTDDSRISELFPEYSLS